MKKTNLQKGFINIIIALTIGALAVVAGALLQKQTAPKIVPTPVKIERVNLTPLENRIRNLETQKSDKVGAVPTFTSGKVYTLYGGGVASTDTTIKLSSFLQPVSGQPILTADLIQGVGASFYITIEPSTNRKETVGCTAVTQSSDGTATLSGCTRGYMFTYPYTASSTLRLSHSGGSRVVLSDSPQLYNDIISYVNTITAAGVVDSSATAKGIVEKATGAEAGTHAAVGSGNTTAPLALTTDIASSTRTGSNQIVVVASTTGYIDSSFLSISGSSVASGPTNIASTTFIATTTSGTWTKQSNLRYLTVELVGGGGGGGSESTTYSGGGGGGGGGYCKKIILASTLGATETVTIGAGGTAGSSSVGGTGGTTSFGSHCSATGGNGGGRGANASTNGYGGNGGVGSGGQLNLAGGGGGSGSGSTGSIAGNVGGAGGSSHFGGGAAGVVSNAIGSTTPATNYGAGGGGGVRDAGGELAGGAGTAGIVIITEVYY